MKLSGLSLARQPALSEHALHQRAGRMAKNRGIITTAQDAISDVARTGVAGARSIAGSAVDTAAGAANSAAKAVTGAARTAVRGARRLVGPARKRKAVKRRSNAKKAVKRRAVAKRRPAKKAAGRKKK
jgi:hypothetical protein